LEDDRYLSNNSYLTSLEESFFSQVEAKHSNIVVMLVMVMKVANFKEQLASTKAMLDRVSKENAENDIQIKS